MTARFDALYDDSGGNPFYLLELARLRRERMRRRAATAGCPRRSGSRSTASSEASRATGRSLINSAAVVGDPFSLDLSTRAAGLDTAQGVDALDELVESGLVHPTDVPRRFQFRHPLVRAAIYDAVPHGTRLAIHSTCADLLRGGERPGRARTSRRAGRAAGRHRGGGGASRRRARVRATRARERARAGCARRCACSPTTPIRPSARSCCSRCRAC